ncbi:MAG: hypothetical protein NTZ49_01415 [Candidatus Parcubacteria bacterium]|nr:hypothetical protein [Candidatus Parcubacteria bacterium]
MNYSQNLSLGWKDGHIKNQAMIKRRSFGDLCLSIIIAFFVIFIVGQLLCQIDYLVRLPLIKNKVSVINPFHINSASAASNEAQKMIQSQANIEVVKNSKNVITIGFKNLGSKTWNKTGRDKVEIKLLRGSSFIQRGILTANKNAKGQIGYFDLSINAADTKGTYTYNYALVRNDKEIISGGKFQLKVKVVDQTAIVKKAPATNNTVVPAKVVAAEVSSAPKVETADQNIKVTDQMAIGRQCLDYSVKRFLLDAQTQKIIDQCKKIGVDLTSNIWVEPNTVVVPSTPAPTPETIIQPSSTPAPIPTPTSPPSPVAQTSTAFDSTYGPQIRVGLFSTADPVLITANGNYKIIDQNKNVLAAVTSGITTTVTFNFSTRTYTFSANGQNLATSSYLRLEPETLGTVFEIASLSQIPDWNKTLNFNKFLGILEVRYSPATNKLWVINELQLEYYLKGLAETSNGSPIEYQKTMVTAARTYAMYHYNRGTKHAAEYYTIDATYDQVYRGYGSQLKQTQVGEAVEATKGQVVTYNGEVVVTPYFSYSDGRTRTWTEVWGGPAKPWCVSVKEPDNYDKTTMWGHGVGLSAHGALHLAYYYNYTFDQILKYYYTGIEVKKIY